MSNQERKEWTIQELEELKEYGELDIFYEILDLLLSLEVHAEKSNLSINKTSSKILRRESLNLIFLSSLLRTKMCNKLKGDDSVPKVLINRIKKKKKEQEGAEERYKTRLENLKKAASKESERIKNLRIAKEELKKKHEERRKKEKEEQRKAASKH